MRKHRARFPRTARTLPGRVGLTLAALAAAAAVAPLPAAAHESPPKYGLEIVEGVTTRPEESIVHTYGYAEHVKSVRVTIVHGGSVAFQHEGHEGVWLDQVPAIGDVVTLEAPVGTLIASETYDGMPTMDPTVCAGSANFSGQRSLGQTVEGRYFTATPYGERNRGAAQVTALTGTTFGGGFLVPLLPGETVAAIEKLETPLPGGPVFTYESENVRPVGACPVPPPPPYVPPPPPALAGAIVKLVKATVHSLLKHGWSDQVQINQPGTVTQDLFQQGGTVPAFASRARHRTPPALLLARGAGSAAVAGKVTVVLHVVSKARRRLRSAHTVHGVLVTTLRTPSGARLSLPRRFVTLHR
jgi:hypothetical protein